MKQPDEVKLEFVREWLQKAEMDFRTAMYLFDSGEDFLIGTVFHAQQAAEKYLKTFLVWRQIEFQKTHDLAMLLNLVAQVEIELAETLNEAVELTPYGVEYRYPGDYPEVTRRDAQRAINLIQLVREKIRDRLPAQVLGTPGNH